MSKQKNNLKNEIKASLENKFLRQSMDNFAVAYREGQKKTFSGIDKEALVNDISSIKGASISAVTDLYNTFKANARKKGVKVHYAGTADDANRIIAGIAREKGCKIIVKSKSMTSEETHLNTFLGNNGLEVTETDLGEWIIQLRREGPSHMVMPAIHLSRYQVADLFGDVTQKSFDPENIEKLVKVARKELKEKFFQADMGITGANFLLADTGTAGIVTNEGNARLTSTLPDTHVILTGIDKILPGLKQALAILKVLPKNATGQAITSYVTWITGQGESSGSKKDKKDIHIVILDNGRSKVASDPIFSEALKCVRCGACANVCPVYRMVGGHTMGHVYIGAIGLILTFLFHGKKNAKKLIGNCIGCGACKDICAASIDLPEVIRHTSRKLSKEEDTPISGKFLSYILKDRKTFHKLLKLAKFAQKPFSGSNGFLRHLPLMFTPEHNFKSLPAIAKKPFREIWKQEQYTLENPKLNIAIFAGCLQDFVYPEHLLSFLKVLKENNIQAYFPFEQSCCGLPLRMTDNMDAAQKVAQDNVAAFGDREYDSIVTLCASCTLHLKDGYINICEGSGNMDSQKVKAFAGRITSSSVFINEYVKIKKTHNNESITFHTPCHLKGLEKGLACAKHILKSTGADIIIADEENTCCGFGGSYSTKHPEISATILDRKIEDFVKTGADIIATECPGCLLQLRGGIDKKNLNMKVRHISELLE
ncbi:MAG: (Fe-S)-binding protein [Desulfobacteraceae bacterium]|nr:(Fe-S)-binding protein [Desulfobacteraceae bacterium]